MTRSRFVSLTVLGALIAAATGLLPTTTTAMAAGAPPTVSAGADQVVTVADRVFLDGQVSDDGVPEASRLAITWSVVSGPGAVTIGRQDEAHTSATFSATGTYVLRLRVSDGDASATDDLSITVRQAADTVIRVPADYPTIQSALDAAPARALVLVAPGTYRESLVVPRTVTLASTYYTSGDRTAVDNTVIASSAATTDTVLV